MSRTTQPVFSPHMHPLAIPSASPVFLPEGCSSLSPTFFSSLETCSSHGFSSLQSPSAFPSFDSIQQIEAFQPLSLDSADLCGCHRPHCYGGATPQDGSASHGSLNTSSSEWPCLHHHVNPQKHECLFHCSPKQTPSRGCQALCSDLGLDCISAESSPSKSPFTAHSVSLHSSSSSLWDNTECSALLPIQDGCIPKETPTPRGFEPLSSEAREHAGLLRNHDSNDGGYALHRHNIKNQQFELFETDSWIDDTDCNDGLTTHSWYENSRTMPPEVASSVLTSLSHSVPEPTIRDGDADDKENLKGHVVGSREKRAQLADTVVPFFPLESKLNCKREGKKEVLQDSHETTKKVIYIPCKKEVFLATDATNEGSKENVRPHVLEQARNRVGHLKADCNGWMCPKDAKKNFKPKPRQLMLDKWLIRQR